MITMDEASIHLDVTVANLSLSNRYNSHVHKDGAGKNSCMYDIESYLKQENKEEVFVARVGLLIEYLNKELNITYTYIAKLGGITKQYVSGLVLSYSKAFKLLEAIKEFNLNDYNAFKKYYEMEIKWNKNYYF